MVRVLGSVDMVLSDGSIVSPSSRQRRTLLSLLARSGSAPVTADELLDQAWNGSPPDSGRRALRFHISKLRSELANGAIETIGSGYRLTVHSDLELFEATTDPDVLELWRGRPFADAQGCAQLEHHASQLHERRLVLVERSAELLIEQDRATDAVLTLAPECDANPLRESLWRRLALALYLSGNSASALRKLSTIQNKLRTSVGVEPSPDILTLEQQILNHDPALVRMATDNYSSGHAARTKSELEPKRPRIGRVPRQGNLPRPATSFIGRVAELQQLEAVLDNSRLLVITGAGGSGKTRLAVELANRVASRFQNGAWIVDLSQLDDATQLTAAVAGALGLQRSDGRPARDVICDALVAQTTLIVFDTCEHLTDSVSELVESLLGRCDGLTVVATSRAKLTVSSAVSRAIEPLGTDSVVLFEARASATRLGFSVSSDNRSQVERICEELDGLPLAIELVAARVGTFDVDTLLARLSGGRLGMIANPYAASDRHGTLSKTIDWSYRLLTPEEQALFCRLSIFHGGSSLEAIEAICADGELVTHDRIVDLVEYLVDMSMLTTVDVEWVGRRYRLLDTTRAFGRERLSEGAVVEPLREQHARHYARWYDEAATTDAWGEGAGRVRRQAVADLSNMRLAAEWAIGSQDVEVALTLASTARFLLADASRYDAGSWLAPALDLPDAESSDRFVDAVVGVRSQFWGVGDIERALALTERCLALGRHSAPLHSGAMALLRSKSQQVVPTDVELRARAHGHARQAFELAQGDVFELVMVYTPFLAQLFERGLHEEVVERWHELEKAVADQPSAALRVYVANCSGPLSLVDPQLARPIIEAALPLSVELGMPYMTTRLRSHLAKVVARAGRPHDALLLLLETIEEEIRRGSWFTGWGWMHRMVPILVELGRPQAAVQLHHAIPTDEGMIWVGDSPSAALEAAEEALGSTRMAELAQLGRTMSRAELLSWLHQIIEATSPLDDESADIIRLHAEDHRA